MRISPNNKKISLSKKTIAQELITEKSLNGKEEFDIVNHWLTHTLPFVSKLQNEEDKARTILFKKELKNKS